MPDPPASPNTEGPSDLVRRSSTWSTCMVHRAHPEIKPRSLRVREAGTNGQATRKRPVQPEGHGPDDPPGANPPSDEAARTSVLITPDEHTVTELVTDALECDDRIYQRAGEVVRAL